MPRVVRFLCAARVSCVVVVVVLFGRAPFRFPSVCSSSGVAVCVKDGFFGSARVHGGTSDPSQSRSFATCSWRFAQSTKRFTQRLKGVLHSGTRARCKRQQGIVGGILGEGTGRISRGVVALLNVTALDHSSSVPSAPTQRRRSGLEDGRGYNTLRELEVDLRATRFARHANIRRRAEDAADCFTEAEKALTMVVAASESWSSARRRAERSVGAHLPFVTHLVTHQPLAPCMSTWHTSSLIRIAA